jgi:outer membrane protein OmpA-like peptidoglycan-associated protein/tetratricopeptide (TPR) repeat protein
MKLSWYLYFFLFLFISACSFTKNANDGESAFERKQYAAAIPMLEDEFHENNNARIKARKAFQLAVSYQKINENSSSIPWFEEAVNNRYGAEAYKKLAFAHKQEENYKQAINYFRRWGQDGGQKNEVQREISICELLMESNTFGNKANYTVEPLDLNSPFAEYAPCIFDENYLVFTADRESATGDEIYKWTNQDFSDLYIMQKSGGEAQLFDEFLNTEHNEGAACFSQDFNEIFFTRCFSTKGQDQFCKILWSRRDGESWSEPSMPFYMEDDINYGHPTLVENDSVMIFTCDKTTGSGGWDLYYSVRLEDGWSSPDIMPEYLNSVGNEMFPRSDGDTLYYSSDFLPGMGGLDIFKTYLKPTGKWESPINLGSPINSGADDFSFVIDRYANNSPDILAQGYFSSSRLGQGNDDLYRFEMRVPEIIDEEELIAEGPDETAEEKKILLFIAGKVVEKIFAEENDPNSSVIGKKAIPNSSIKIIEEVTSSMLTNKNGLFVLELERDKEYIFKASKKGFLNNEIEFSTKNLDLEGVNEDVTYNVEIVLDKIYRDKEIVLNNIYYDFNKWDIRQDAKPVLNQFAKILKNNPQIDIQLLSHTDCRGTNEYNQELSQKRAQSVVDYLISIGIDSQRMSPKGYGENALADDCICNDCTEKQHQTNRRTTFKILD